jgi:hypothetical protein
MKKLFVAILISVSVIGLSLTQMDINAQSGISGSTVSLSSEFINSNVAIDVNRALELYKAGQALAFKSNGKIYFVMNAAGNLDTKNLVKHAGKDYTIGGSVKSAKGFNYIIANSYN